MLADAIRPFVDVIVMWIGFFHMPCWGTLHLDTSSSCSGLQSSHQSSNHFRMFRDDLFDFGGTTPIAAVGMKDGREVCNAWRG